MPGKLHSWLVVLVAFLVAQVAWAGDEIIGHVKDVTGEVHVSGPYGRLPAKVGMELRANDILETGDDGAVGVTLRDNTRISLGADTKASVEEFIYEPEKENLSLVTKISQGSLLFVSGTIAKLKPEQVKIETPSTTIGVRGTRFVVEVDDDICISIPECLEKRG